ncbi:MAG: hypothetical protein ACOC2W_03005 [bacterium]
MSNLKLDYLILKIVGDFGSQNYFKKKVSEIIPLSDFSYENDIINLKIYFEDNKSLIISLIKLINYFSSTNKKKIKIHDIHVKDESLKKLFRNKTIGKRTNKYFKNKFFNAIYIDTNNYKEFYKTIFEQSDLSISNLEKNGIKFIIDKRDVNRKEFLKNVELFSNYPNIYYVPNILFSEKSIDEIEFRLEILKKLKFVMFYISFNELENQDVNNVVKIIYEKYSNMIHFMEFVSNKNISLSLEALLALYIIMDADISLIPRYEIINKHIGNDKAKRISYLNYSNYTIPAFEEVYPNEIPKIMNITKKAIFLCNKALWEHPESYHSGAKAMKLALNYSLKNRLNSNNIDKHHELAKAVHKWGK